MTSESTIRRHRRKELFDRLKFSADLACESHESRHVAQVLEVALKLLRLRATREKVKELLEILRTSTDENSELSEMDGLVYIHGFFVLNELDKRIVWGSGVSVQEIST